MTEMNRLFKLMTIPVALILATLMMGGREQVAASSQPMVVAESCYYTYLPLIMNGANGGAAGAPSNLTCDDPGSNSDIVDFNDDGYADLAIGVPYEGKSPLVLESGAVQVLYGTADGLSADDEQYWTQTSLLGSSQAGELFGWALTAADFDGDGVTDLAVSSPGEDRDGMNAVGQIDVIYGYPTTGLTANGTQTFAQGLNGIAGAGEEEDRFGETLVSGDFNGDGYADLAVGVPEEDLESDGITGMGAVNILYGSEDGLQAADNQLIHMGLDSVSGNPNANDHFAEALAAADFNGDGTDDLAVGIPGYDIAGDDNVGVVEVFLGGEAGLSLLGESLWRQGFNGVQGAPEAFDGFGRTLTAGDFDGNGADDLAVGVPGEDVAFGGGDVTDAGAIHILYGYSLAGGLSGSGDQLWHQGQADILGIPETLDRFGQALVAADFDGNGTDDLAVGVPYQNGTETDQGYVQVFYSNGSMLSPAGQDLWTQGAVNGAPEAEDYFGYTLSAGDFNGDGKSDLVVGVPYEDVLVDGVNRIDAGAINVIYGFDSGLGAVGNQIWHQQSAGIADESEGSDRFGLGLAR